MNKDKIIKEFVRYCKMDENKLKIELFEELRKYYKKLKFADGFILAKGDIPVMLVAHMDTVHKNQCNDSNIFINMENNIICSTNGIGGDDRCGIFMIMDILKNTKHRPYILFTEDEECGGLGAKKFVKRYNSNNTNLNFIIELDRMNGHDSVYYDLDNYDFEDYINKYGFKTAYGSYTDICELCPAFDCAGVNLSCGYYKQHTTSEYVNIDEMLTTIYKVVRILEDFKLEDKFKWKEIEMHYYPTTYTGYNKYGGIYDGYDLHSCYDSYTITSTCDYCGLDYPTSKVKMVEDCDTWICEDCMSRYGLRTCKECGVALFYDTKGEICEDCRYWNEKMLEKERIDV
jgi:hypothetical protein